MKFPTAISEGDCTSNYLLPKLANCTSESVFVVIFRAVMFISELKFCNS